MCSFGGGFGAGEQRDMTFLISVFHPHSFPSSLFQKFNLLYGLARQTDIIKNGLPRPFTRTEKKRNKQKIEKNTNYKQCTTDEKKSSNFSHRLGPTILKISLSPVE